MPSPFADRDAKLSRVVDRVFGEWFTFSARVAVAADVDLPLIADATRPNFRVRGPFHAPFQALRPIQAPLQPVHPQPRDARRGKHAQAHARTASKPSISIDDSALAWTPREGDTVTREFDNSIYEISRSLSDSFGRTIFLLTARKR